MVYRNTAAFGVHNDGIRRARITLPMPLASIFEEAASNTLPNGDELVAAGAPHDMRFAQPV